MIKSWLSQGKAFNYLELFSDSMLLRPNYGRQFHPNLASTKTKFLPILLLKMNRKLKLSTTSRESAPPMSSIQNSHNLANWLVKFITAILSNARVVQWTNPNSNRKLNGPKKMSRTFRWNVAWERNCIKNKQFLNLRFLDICNNKNVNRIGLLEPIY